MTTLAGIMVLAALGTIAYVYVGYPLVLWVLAKIRRRDVKRADVTPSVTLLISAYNEEEVVARKLENSLALDYPQDRLTILVISDASVDGTDRIVQSFASRGVTLLRMPERGGKTAGLNAAVQKAQSDIILFSDANILYQKDVVRALVRNFADPTIGCVTGDSRYLEGVVSAAHVQENSYWGYERFIRALESTIGSTVGGDGAIFAIRRELYTPLRPDAINDLMIPLQIVLRGYRAIFEPAAVGIEPSAGHFKGEFRRKRRIVNRSWRCVMSMPQVLSRGAGALFAWQVWSHKVLRWLVLPLIVVAAAGCLLGYNQGIEFRLIGGGIAASLLIAAFGAMLPRQWGGVARLAQGIMYFYLVNLAAVLGIGMAMTGRVEMLWTPERR
jgi:cellulose synthase/poly-beta-1,6-N-acetylglucosamine synthase-like glycosyltransferase